MPSRTLLAVALILAGLPGLAQDAATPPATDGAAAPVAPTTPLAGTGAAAPTAPDAAPAAEETTPGTAGDSPISAAPAADAAPAAPDSAAPDTAAPVAAAADTAAPVTAETARTGQPYVAETHGDWAIRCVKSDDGDDPCQLYQLMSDTAGGPLAEITMTPVSDGDTVALATIITPLETLLTEGLAISIDGGAAQKVPFEFCTRQGCWVRIGLRTGDLAAFQRGASATVRIVPIRAPDQAVDAKVSLSGITAGWTALNARLSAD